MTLEYKKTLFHYTPADNPSKSDNLVCEMDGLAYEEVYKKAYELSSAICFAERAKIILGGGLTDVLMAAPINNMNIRQIENRIIPINETRSILRAVALAKTDEQAMLLRLFRHAYSVNDPFTQTMFYWHTLVYPNTKEDAAVQFVTENLPKLKENLSEFRPNAVEHLFAESRNASDFGKYVREGVRDSIAHIVRNRAGYLSLEMDNLHHIWHVQYIAECLENLCRLRLEQEFKLEIGLDEKILRFVEI